jgi:hypothetical protein
MNHPEARAKTAPSSADEPEQKTERNRKNADSVPEKRLPHLLMRKPFLLHMNPPSADRAGLLL